MRDRMRENLITQRRVPADPSVGNELMTDLEPAGNARL
jgi:hypothetical protein